MSAQWGVATDRFLRVAPFEPRWRNDIVTESRAGDSGSTAPLEASLMTRLATASLMAVTVRLAERSFHRRTRNVKPSPR